MSIQIFSCDHRKNVNWNLPYLRFGGIESDCAIRCENKIFDIDVNADETPKLFWLWKNIDNFGCDIIGYCQYRRFFTGCKVNVPVIDIPRNDFKREFAMQPNVQELLILKTHADGILHPSFDVINKSLHKFTYIWEQIYILEGDKNIQQKYQKFAFDLLLKYTPTELKEYMEQSFSISQNYLCNIFTCKTDIFKLFGNIAFNAVYELLQTMTLDERNELHPYWLAYVFERYTNCFYHCLELSGKYKFLKIPLMTLDGNIHINWNKNK